MSVARILALLFAIAFVGGLAGTFGWTYREQSHTVSNLRRERTDLRVERRRLRAENARLAAAMASAQSAFGTLNSALDSSRRGARAANVAAGERYLEGYAAGWLWASGTDPLGAADTLDAGSRTGYAGR